MSARRNCIHVSAKTNAAFCVRLCNSGLAPSGRSPRSSTLDRNTMRTSTHGTISQYSVISTSNGEVGQVPALERALVNTPPNFWACRPTHGSKQIIRVPKFASVQDGNTPPHAIVCPLSSAHGRANGQYAYLTEQGTGSRKARRLPPILGTPVPNSPTGTVGCSVLGQKSHRLRNLTMT